MFVDALPINDDHKFDRIFQCWYELPYDYSFFVSIAELLKKIIKVKILFNVNHTIYRIIKFNTL